MKRTALERKPLQARRTPLKRKSSSLSKKRSKTPQKGNFAALAREWGLPPTYSKKTLRYRSPVEKGIAWFWFARYIRARDWKKYGTCISCGNPKTYEQFQAGHFVPASVCGVMLLMSEENVNGECGGCNGFDLMHLLGYARNLDLRYGAGTADRLISEKNHDCKDLKRAEYLEKAAYYKAKWEELMLSTGGTENT